VDYKHQLPGSFFCCTDRQCFAALSAMGTKWPPCEVLVNAHTSAKNNIGSCSSPTTTQTISIRRHSWITCQWSTAQTAGATDGSSAVPLNFIAPLPAHH
jgi:hypothetical protein